MHQQSQRLRRELNSHNEAKPRTAIARQRTGQCFFIGSGETELRCFNAEWQAKQGLGRHGVAQDGNDRDPPCRIEWQHCVGSPALQSVRRAAAAREGASGLGPLVRRLQSVACHARRRGAGSTCGGPPGTTGPWQAQLLHTPGAVLPNPSVNRTRYGRPAWPGRRYPVHFRQPGQAVLPQRSGYLER